MTQAAFKQYFEQYFDAIRNYIYFRSADAELATDIAQDSFLRLWEKRKRFSETQIKALLYKIAGQLFLDHCRRQKTATAYQEQMRFDWASDSTEEAIAYEELKAQYESALAKLPENQRLVFLMSRMEGLSYKEIALRLQIGQKAVEKRMSKALKSIKKEISVYEA